MAAGWDGLRCCRSSSGPVSEGLERIELNVFGANAPARGLYRSLGYEEIAVYMGKTL